MFAENPYELHKSHKMTPHNESSYMMTMTPQDNEKAADYSEILPVVDQLNVR